MSEQPVPVTVVEIPGEYLSQDRIVMMPDPRRAEERDVIFAVTQAEEQTQAEFKAYLAEHKMAVREVHAQWRFTITALGYSQPEIEGQEPLPSEEFQALVDRAQPTPTGTLMADYYKPGPSGFSDRDIDLIKETERLRAEREQG